MVLSGAPAPTRPRPRALAPTRPTQAFATMESFADALHATLTIDDFSVVYQTIMLMVACVKGDSAPNHAV